MAWDTGLRNYFGERCPFIGRDRILIDLGLVYLAEELSSRLPGLEWLFYSRYRRLPGYIVVYDAYIPEQLVSSASVRVEDKNLPENYRVVVHRHPFDYESFSHTDDTYINVNNDVSLLYTTRFVRAYVRERAPCGAYLVHDAEIAGIITRESSDPVMDVREWARKVAEESIHRIRVESREDEKRHVSDELDALLRDLGYVTLDTDSW